MSYKILLVDDDQDLVEMLCRYFRLKGYEMLTAVNGMDAVKKSGEGPDLILLDINMPGMDGLEVCRRIRDQMSCPILFLTARVEEQDRVNGLMMGGDDYIVKPFSLKELEARVLAHLRREERHQQKTQYRFGNGMMVDYTAKTASFDGQVLDLTKTEFGILEFLSMHPGQVFDKERIYEHVCGYDGQGDSRGITELVRRIRGKMGQYTKEDPIETVWGVGYRWKK